MTTLRSLLRSTQTCWRLAALLAFTLWNFAPASGQDVRFYGVVKGQGFVQTNGGLAVLEGAVLQVFVSTTGEGAVSNALLRAPNGATVPLHGDGHDLDFEQFFPSTAELDVAFPNGTYTLELATAHDGQTTNALHLTGNAYPSTPHFSNLGAAQMIDPATPFTLTWDPISGATSNDFLQLEISECTGERVFETPSPEDPGALNGALTSFLIPARALRPGQQYEVAVMIGRFVSVNTNSHPGAKGIAAYFARVGSKLATLGTQTGCPVGRFEMVFNYPHFSFGGSTQGVVNFPQGVSYYFALFNLWDEGNTNFPPRVTFSGPPGSGLNNSTNQHGGFGDSSAWFSSPTINTPPFPPGGVYSVNLGGTNLQFNLLDPDPGSQQVLLVPTAIVNNDGLLTELRWTYKNVDGATIGPQPFMAGIQIRIQGNDGGLYDAGSWDEKIPPASNHHVLGQPVRWTDVSSIQMLFDDVAGNSVASYWQNSTPSLQIVTPDLPPGVLEAPYFGALEAFGGVPPYAWSILGGALPPGLGLNASSGAIGGTATNAGSFDFTVQVTDSQSNHVARGYFIRIDPANTPPHISHIADQHTQQGAGTAPNPFTVGDVETPASQLFLSGVSSDQTLVRDSNIDFAGGGSNRNVTVRPEPNKTGTVAITVTVSDGASAASSTFAIVIESVGPPPATSPNVESYIVIKGQEFMQTGPGAPVAADPFNVVFRSWVSVEGETSITNATLGLPNNNAFDMSTRYRDFELEASFDSISAMDAVYPNGTYAFILATANAGAKTNTLTLTGNSYPATPHLSNFAAAQAVDPTNDFTLAWDAIPGATTNDIIFINVRDCHGEEIFSTPSPEEPGVLRGNTTSVVIPGRTLNPGQTYKIEMFVGRISQIDTSSIPGALGLAGYFKQLEAPLLTIGAPENCPFGRLHFTFRFRPGGFVGHQGVSGYPQGIEQYQVNFSTEDAVDPPESITFTGPPGSGIDNTPSVYSGVGDEYAWYGSAPVNTPPLPPGGIYSVNYKDTVYPHHILPPNAAGQQVLIVPSVIINGAGQVTEINWTYRDLNGELLSPQPFMRHVQARLNGANGSLFPDANHDHSVPPATTNLLVDPPIPWRNVFHVQMSFRDMAGNEFESGWQRSSPSVQIATPMMPSGIVSSAYRFAAMAFGGHPPYEWSIQAGNFPPGLELDANTGEIAGIPAALGAFNFTLRVTDTNSQHAERSFSIHILPDGPDATTYVVAKGRRFLQTSANPPVPATPGYQFISFVESQVPGRVTNATLELPGGLVRTLTNDFDRLTLERSFLDQDALDAAFANGSYVFTIAALNDGPQTSSLLLSNNAYPLPPRLANWSAAQGIDARTDFELSWNPFTGGSSNDLIVLSVMDGHGRELFSTPGYLEPEFLNGLATSAVIPANILAPSFNHTARLLFVKRTAFDAHSYPGVPGLAAYFAETAFGINTLNPAGIVQFSVANYTADENAGTVEITVHRLGGSEGTVTVAYATTVGSATTNDYVPTSGTLAFDPDVTSQTFSISLTDDETPERAETVGLVLSTLTGSASLGAAHATLAIADDDRPPGPNVSYYIAAKSQAFVQNGAGAPTLAPDEPFRFGAFAREAFSGGLVSAALRNPGGITNELVKRNDDSNFEYDHSFPTKAALDAAFRSGTYLFSLNTLNDGTITPSLTLPADAYPSTPHLANWTAAQAINAFANFRLNWDPFASGSALDFVEVSLRDPDMDGEVFHSGGFAEPGALNGTNTSVTIPGGTLAAGKVYQGHLLFANLAALESEDYPDVTGVGAYFKEMEFAIATATPPPPQGQIQFADPSQSVSETNSVATVMLARVGGSQGEVSVTVTTTNGAATAGADFAGSSQTVNFGDGQNEAPFTFEILDDSIYEGPEAMRLLLSNPTGGATLAGQTNTAVVIVDDELPPTPGSLQFSAPAYTGAESAGSLTITVTRSGGSRGEVTVDYATVPSSASPDGDYEEASGTLTFPNGATSRTFTIEINDDDLDETNEVLQVVLSNPSNGAALGARSSARVGITDNDSAGTIGFVPATYSVSETGVVAEIIVKRTGGLAEGVTVDYAAVSVTATEGDDFEATAGTLEFAAGETEMLIVVPILDDALPEGNESLRLTLSNVTGGAALGSMTNASLAIIDDEVVIQFSRTSVTNSEGTPLVAFAVTRTGPVDDEVTVDYSTADDTALAGEDYAETNGTIVFPAGVTSRSFAVRILNDTVAEDDESFAVTLSNPSGTAQLGPRDTANVLILDNDEAGVIAFSATNYSVKETAPVALVTVTRIGGKASDVSVDFEVLDGIGTADAADDYVTTNGTLTFGAGVARLTFAVPIQDDAIVEGAETIALRLSNPTGGATLGARDEATLKILDNDVPGAIRFSAATYRVSETGTLATITVLRSGGRASVSVDYAANDGTATDGDDYTATSGVLSFGSNEVTKTFTVPILDDSLPDGNETVLLTLRNPGGGPRLIGPTNATLTILDNELGVQFARATYTVVEGVRSVALSVVRAGASPTAFTVQYATADETATAGSDYTAKSGTLTFGPSVTSQTITIPIRNDIAAEDQETFSVTLSNPSGAAQLGPRSVATITIADNDGGLLRARGNRRR